MTVFDHGPHATRGDEPSHPGRASGTRCRAHSVADGDDVGQTALRDATVNGTLDLSDGRFGPPGPPGEQRRVPPRRRDRPDQPRTARPHGHGRRRRRPRNRRLGGARGRAPGRRVRPLAGPTRDAVIGRSTRRARQRQDDGHRPRTTTLGLARRTLWPVPPGTPAGERQHQRDRRRRRGRPRLSRAGRTAPPSARLRGWSPRRAGTWWPHGRRRRGPCRRAPARRAGRTRRCPPRRRRGRTASSFRRR